MMSVIDYSWNFSKEEFDLDLDFFNEKEQEDKLWQARTGLNPETLCGAIESIIFMSERPISIQKIKNYIDTDLPLRVLHESIARLQEEYEQKHHGVRLMEVAEGYQFRTKATFSKYIQAVYKVSAMQLSPTALEVLAIIAYKQPISKVGVEKVRGVDSSHIIRALMDKRLVKTAGKSEEVGRPSLYATTPEFLEIFNLNDLNDLPSEHELDELADTKSVGDIKSIVQLEKKRGFDLDELQELDELSSSIKSISAETLFTKSLVDLEKSRKTESGEEKKSAFDLLEEYLNKSQVIEQNKESINSELVTNVIEPKAAAINQLSNMSELLNAPEVEQIAGELSVEEIDEFQEKLDQMLETSQKIIDDEIEADDMPVFDNESQIDSELDKAFDNLFGADFTQTESEDENR